MKVLVISDDEERILWEDFRKEAFADVDLIISCGDLCQAYLEFLVSMVNVPLLYVMGNHDSGYLKKPPEGCISLENRVVTINGVRFAGLGGSLRYKEGPLMYAEAQMKRRVSRLRWQIRRAKGIDVLVTHAPLASYGDLDDLPHRGFTCFAEILTRHHPRYMLHGHVHQAYGHFLREREHPSGTKIVNASGHVMIDL